MTTGRVVGLVLIIAGVAICGIVSLFLGLGATGSGPSSLSPAGAVLGVALFGLLPLLILGGIGVFLFIKGGQEATEMADVQKKERLLGMVQAAGKVSLGSIAIELKMTQQQVKDAIFELVNQGLFSGYINWKEGMFLHQRPRTGADDEMSQLRGPTRGGWQRSSQMSVLRR